MPTQTYSSFEAYFAANRHTGSRRVMVLGREYQDWEFTSLMIGKLSVQWGRPGAGVIVEGPSAAGGVTIYILPHGSSGGVGNGRQFDDCSVMVGWAGDEYSIANHSGRRWCSLHIPNEMLACASKDATTPVGLQRGHVQLPPYQIERFRSVLGQLDHAVQLAPSAFASAAAQKTAAQKLVEEIRNVLTVPHEFEHLRGHRVVPLSQIISMAVNFVDQHDGSYLSVEQLAAVAGVSERTLRDAFQRYFGLAPVQYLKRRTLHQVRGALRTADPSQATVTDIATQCGVWQFGRMARDYRALFGELPSKTLRNLN